MATSRAGSTSSARCGALQALVHPQRARAGRADPIDNRQFERRGHRSHPGQMSATNR
jgi:hypothetical protein